MSILIIFQASEPHLTGIDSECSYHFVWETVHACKLSDKPVTSSNCTVQNPQTGSLKIAPNIHLYKGY